MNIKRGVIVHAYGRRQDNTGDISKPVWDIDKGEFKCLPIYAYSVLMPLYAAPDMSRLTLVIAYTSEEVAADGKPVYHYPNGSKMESGDKFVLNGNAYIGDGDAFGWITFSLKGVQHFEIPLKAFPGE